MKTAWISILLMGCVFLAAAQPVVTADWIDGTVERMVGSSWRTVEIGDTFGTDATLRLAKGASAELASGGVRVHLTAPGVYKLSEAFDKARGRSGTSATVAKALKLAGKNDYDLSTSSTAGVRGEASGPASVSWVEEEDSSDPYSEVRALYEAGEYARTSERARGLRLSDSPAAAFRSAYWDASALFAQGLAVPALKTIEKAPPDSRAPEYRDASLLTARILMELAEWPKALSSLNAYAPADSPVEDRQLALILASVCHESMGKKADSRKALETALSLDPKSSLGQEAAARLGR